MTNADSTSGAPSVKPTDGVGNKEVISDESIEADLRFQFGANWQNYLDKALSEEKIEIGKNQTIDFLKLPNLEGKTLIDIGCGSGMFSLSAHRLGAERIFSFDNDINSVKCTEFLHQREGKPENWEITQGSVLDAEFMGSLPKFDVVYSWGVLHHTGDMYRAIRNAATLVAPGGLFYIALYNKQEYQSLKQWRGSHFYYKLKRFYNKAGPLTRGLMIKVNQAKQITGMLLSGKNPIKEIEAYSNNRGMDWTTDIKDWLGGYPFEFAKVDEIFKFCQSEFGFELENLYSTISLGCNEFLFRYPEK